MRPPVRLAAQVGESLGRGSLLFRRLPRPAFQSPTHQPRLDAAERAEPSGGTPVAGAGTDKTAAVQGCGRTRPGRRLHADRTEGTQKREPSRTLTSPRLRKRHRCRGHRLAHPAS